MKATRVKVTCPACGHVRLSSDDVRLVLAARGPYYLFRCPGCQQRVRRPAPEEVVAALTERGVLTVRAVPAAGAGNPPSGQDGAG